MDKWRRHGDDADQYRRALALHLGSIANQNTLTYILINLRFLQRLRQYPTPD
jgi:hypothetical protein